MFKKVFLTALTAAVIGVTSYMACYASGTAEFSNITFVNESGDIAESYRGQLTAQAQCINNSDKEINATMLVCEYRDEILTKLWYNGVTVAAGEEKTVSAEFSIEDTAGVRIRATLLDDLKSLNVYRKTAVMRNNSANLASVSVDGKRITEYSNSNDSYLVKCAGSSAAIGAVPSDGGCTVDFDSTVKVPGTSKITVESPYGEKKEVKLSLYREEEELSQLHGMKYIVDGTEYELSGFDPTVKDYTVQLPDNTFYVTIKPEYMEVASSTEKVEDIDASTITFGSVSYIQGKYIPYLTPRPCLDGVVPIKNEQTKAIISLDYEGVSNTYNITFKCKQPRLTEFNIVGGQTDNYKPMFIGGAAMNNDNGTPAGPDRAWCLGAISERLLGGSLFAFDMGSNRVGNQGEGNTWFQSTNSGEYFNFTADTGGTIYFMPSNTVTNREYPDNGWELIKTGGTVARPSGYGDWKEVPKNYNNWGKDTLFFIRYEWSNVNDRFREGGLTAISSAAQPLYIAETYMKTFEAGETVRVYHPGNNIPCTSAVVIWDI